MSKDREKEERRKKRREREEKASKGPFGLTTLEAPDDIHDLSGKEVLKRLNNSSIKASKKIRVVEPDAPKESKEDRAKRKALKKIAREEQERAEKMLGLLNLKSVPSALKVAFTKALHEQHQELFAFMLTTIAPMELSLDPAVADATEAIKMITGSQDVEISTTRMRAILTDLMDLKMLAYMSRKLRLGDELRQTIINKHFTQPPASASKSTDALRQMLAQQMAGKESPITNRAPSVVAKSIPVRPTRDRK